MSWPKGPRGKRQIWRRWQIWRKRRIWRKFAKGFDEGNDLGRTAPSKVANLVKAANLVKMANVAKFAKGFDKMQLSWLKGPVESDEFGESCKIWQNFVKRFHESK